MEHSNVGVIRKGYDAFMRGDMETARSIFHPDVIWHVAGGGPLSGKYRGFDEIARWGAQLFERSAGTFREELATIVANDSWAVQVAYYQAERNARKIRDQSVNVYRMVDGRVLECWVYFSDVQGFEEFWA
jgi:ketosteroid isomerase-like protein